MYKALLKQNNKVIGTYNSLLQCAKHIKKIDQNMISENKLLLDLFILNNNSEISEYEYKIYKDYYNSL